MKPPRLVWPSLLALAAVAAGLALWLALGGSRGAEQSQGMLESLDVYGELPDFSLTERSGRVVTRAELAGKVWIANFIYTRCTETCPLQTAALARLQPELLKDERVRLVSLTVDPEHDTPAVLRRYAEQYGADPGRWLFLTGDKAAIYRLARDGFKLGVLDPDDAAGGFLRWLDPAPAFATHGSKGLVMHSPRLVLVDGRARIRAYHQPDDAQSIEWLRRNLRSVLREEGRFHTTDARVVFASVARADLGLVRSDDGGARWEPTGLAVDVRAPVVALVAGPGPHVVAATAASDVRRSRDGGRTWQPVLEGGRPVATR